MSSYRRRRRTNPIRRGAAAKLNEATALGACAKRGRQHGLAAEVRRDGVASVWNLCGWRAAAGRLNLLGRHRLETDATAPNEANSRPCGGWTTRPGGGSQVE